MRHRDGRGRRPAVLAAVAAVLTLVMVGAVVLVLHGSTSSDDDANPGPGPGRSSDPLLVRTEDGAVRGITADGVRTWRGLPYAAPPVGDLRWRAPQEPAAWGGVRDASSYDGFCLQPAPYAFGDDDLRVRAGSAEDCLYLNVTAPAAEGDEALPVIVWLHGGGFVKGGGSAVDASVLAARGAVVVTVNYRLGRLGFFAHPALASDVANLGLLDQMAALRWVRANITGFGGDARSVTLMGGSAGAMSVNALMSAPDAAGLFDRAIAESAPGDGAALTLDEARRQGEAAFPDRTAAELRALPAAELLSSTFNVLRGDAPIVDAVLPESAAVAFAAGHEAAVPYLLGTNQGEFGDDDYRAADTDPARVRAALGGTRHAALVASYGDRTYAEHVLNDVVFTAPAAALAVEHASRAPTYRYRFAADSNATRHGAEVRYVFGLEDRPARRALVSAIGRYWLAFARSGDPDVDGLPEWPQAGDNAVLVLALDGPVAYAVDPWTDRLRALYDTVPLRLP